jgi:RNA polymerase sigma-70 factor, ECF subfamily
MADEVDRLYERLLVLRCQMGEETAFTELVERYGPRLSYYLRQVLNGADRVDDVSQDVWLTIYRKITRLAEPAAFGVWLYRIAHDKAALSTRGQRRHCQVNEAELTDPATEEPMFSVDDAELVHAGLAKLAPELREVLVLRFFEEMNYNEIARATDCPVGTVRSRLHYAKQALRCAVERLNNEH